MSHIPNDFRGSSPAFSAYNRGLKQSSTQRLLKTSTTYPFRSNVMKDRRLSISTSRRRARNCTEPACSETDPHTHCNIRECKKPIIRDRKEKKHRERYHRPCQHCKSYHGSTAEVKSHERSCSCNPANASTNIVLHELPRLVDVLRHTPATAFRLPPALSRQTGKSMNFRLQPFPHSEAPRIICHAGLASIAPTPSRVILLAATTLESQGVLEVRRYHDLHNKHI